MATAIARLRTWCRRIYVKTAKWQPSKTPGSAICTLLVPVIPRERCGVSIFLALPAVRPRTGRLKPTTKERRKTAMDIDTDRIDDAVLALLLLGLHDGCRAWKGFDWNAMDRLHEKGMISCDTTHTTGPTRRPG